MDDLDDLITRRRTGQRQLTRTAESARAATIIVGAGSVATAILTGPVTTLVAGTCATIAAVAFILGARRATADLGEFTGLIADASDGDRDEIRAGLVDDLTEITIRTRQQAVCMLIGITATAAGAIAATTI